MWYLFLYFPYSFINVKVKKKKNYKMAVCHKSFSKIFLVLDLVS